MATPDHQQIAERAYRIWEQQGRPQGLDREHWEQAQRELQADDGSFVSEASQPEPSTLAPAGNTVLSRPQRVASSAQLTPGVVKDGNTHRARRS
jgi:hypothetical protein